MRAGVGLIAGVLAAALAGSGCCSECGRLDRRGADYERAKLLGEQATCETGNSGIAAAVADQPAGGVPAAQKPATPARPASTGPTGAYGGTGN